MTALEAERYVEVTAVVDADPDAVFPAITDVARRDAWNDTIVAVINAPDTFEPGAEWVVEMSAFGQRWQSRSALGELNLPARRLRLSHRSCSDDGNPSWADWDWHVHPHRAEAEVVVTSQLHLRTFWRRVLLTRIGNRRLAKREVPASPAALGRYRSPAVPCPGAPTARMSP